MKQCFSPHAQHLNAQQAWTWSKLGWSLLTPYLTSAVCLLIGLSNVLSCLRYFRKHNLRVSRSDRWSSVQLLKRISQYHALLSWDLVLWNNNTYYFLIILHWNFMALHQYLLFIHFLFVHWYDFKMEMSGNSKLKLIKSYVLTIGVGGQHRGPESGGHPSVSRMLSSQLFPSHLSNSSLTSIHGPTTLYSQLTHGLLPTRQPWGHSPPPVLPASYPTHVQWR